MLKSQKGFTLIELVMIIVILGILAAVAVPKYVDMQSDAKLAATDGIKGAVRAAFSIAFASHRVKKVDPSGPTAGDNQFITDCTSAVAYLDGGVWPANTSCASGIITFPSATTATISAETTTHAASI